MLYVRWTPQHSVSWRSRRKTWCPCPSVPGSQHGNLITVIFEAAASQFSSRKQLYTPLTVTSVGNKYPNISGHGLGPSYPFFLIRVMQPPVVASTAIPANGEQHCMGSTPLGNYPPLFGFNLLVPRIVGGGLSSSGACASWTGRAHCQGHQAQVHHSHIDPLWLPWLFSEPPTFSFERLCQCSLSCKPSLHYLFWDQLKYIFSFCCSFPTEDEICYLTL